MITSIASTIAEMMTENDRRLLEAAWEAGNDYGLIDSLIPKAETEECRERLQGYSDHAFANSERAYFERERDWED